MEKVTDKTVQQFVEQGTIRQSPKGQIVIYEGEEIERVFFVYKGSLKVYDIDSSGNEKIVAVLGKGDLFPIIPMFNGISPTTHFHASLTDVDMVVIPKEVFIENVREDIDLALYCLDKFSAHVNDLTRRLSSLEKTDTKAKLYAALAMLHQNHSRKKLRGWSRVNFPVNQQFLADITGVTRESINLAVQSAQEEKVIRTPKSRVLEINPKNLSSAIETG